MSILNDTPLEDWLYNPNSEELLYFTELTEEDLDWESVIQDRKRLSKPSFEDGILFSIVNDGKIYHYEIWYYDKNGQKNFAMFNGLWTCMEKIQNWGVKKEILKVAV